MQLALISLFVVIAVVLVVRAARRDRVEYREFKKLTTTSERQKVFGKWLRESFFIFGGLSAAVLLASWQFVPLAATDALDWPPLAWLKGLDRAWLRALVVVRTRLSWCLNWPVGLEVGCVALVRLVGDVLTLATSRQTVSATGCCIF